MKIRINDHKWDFYALFGLPIYSPFTLSDEEVIGYIIRFYLQHKQITNRQLLSLFCVAFVTLKFYKMEYDHDLKRRNACINRLANKYAHCKDKDRRIKRGLCLFIPKYLCLQVVIWGNCWFEGQVRINVR